MNALLASANADQMVELIARTNDALGQDDQRKVRRDDVRMLRRLAEQARAFSKSLIDHNAERRLVGERRGPVSPEARNTAVWAERLALALETGVTRPVSTRRPRK